MDPVTLDKVEAETKKEPKFAALRQLGEDTLRLLKLVCDPMITFGVTVDAEDQLKRWSGFTFRTDQRTFSDSLYDLCCQLARRDLTGNSALNQVDDLLLASPTIGHLKWACRILNKNLRAGFSSSTLNKIWPGMIEEFEVALATPYEPDKHEILGEYFYEPKLDGLRMVVIGGKAYTRNGRSIETVDHIIKELGLKLDLDDFVFDGEIMGVGDFDESSGTIRRKSEGTNQDLYYNLFDFVYASDWTKKQSTTPFDVRRTLLEANVKVSENVRLVPSKKVNFREPASGEELAKIRDQFISQGYEGGMLKRADAPYEWKRGLAVLKLKKMDTVDCRITDSFEGKGRHKGRLGGVIVEVDGVQTKVGSGFSDGQRDELWLKRNELPNKMVEVQFQNKTRDGSLRFPVFIKFRPDKE